jgi:hypothetical protein
MPVQPADYAFDLVARTVLSVIRCGARRERHKHKACDHVPIPTVKAYYIVGLSRATLAGDDQLGMRAKRWARHDADVHYGVVRRT